jgi:hypothetical protein
MVAQHSSKEEFLDRLIGGMRDVVYAWRSILYIILLIQFYNIYRSID